MTAKSPMQIVAQFIGQNNAITIPRAFIRLCGDTNIALVLNQVVYWCERKGGEYSAITYDEWHEAVCLSAYQVRRGAKALVEMGLIQTKVMRSKYHQFAPVVHYKYNQEALYQALVGLVSSESVKIESEVSSFSESEESEETSTMISSVDFSLKDSPQHANATAGQQSANHASLPMESSLLETDALTDAPAKEPIPLEENISPDEAPMPESQAPAEPSPLEEVKPIGKGAPEKKARKLTPAQLRSNALLTALGTAPEMATKAEGKRAGQVAGELNTIYKRARGEDMTPSDVTAFVEYVKKRAGGQWTVTANSLLMNGRFAGWMEARAKATAKPAPVASSAAYDELMSLRGA